MKNSDAKCPCTTACPPCMGRCGCAFQKAEASLAFVLLPILLAVVTIAVIFRAKLRKLFRAA